MAIDYKAAGVDVEAGDALVTWLQKTNPREFPHKEKLVSGIGGFASLFRADFSHMKKPCLVSGTDGVGTKLKLAFHFNKFDTIGQDLVAMCVNDVLTVGAEPLFFLDYFATGKLELEVAKSFLDGVRKACIESGCALVGGETAEMPGFYPRGEFDCAGFVVGVVDQEKALGPHLVKEGDVVVGISSSGFHSNGYSLVRKLFENDLDKWRDPLLTPTHLYSKLTNILLSGTEVHAFAHVTGGGMENLPRVVPEGMGIRLRRWTWPDLFLEAQRRAKISDRQMLETFNCGVGWAVILPQSKKNNVVKTAESLGYRAFDIGEVVCGVEGVDYSAYGGQA